MEDYMPRATLGVQHSLLAEHALNDYFISAYALPSATTCRFWQRSINDVYLVDTGTSRFVGRIAPTGWRSLVHFDAEIELLHFLDQAGLLVPQPVASPEGVYVQALQAPEGLRYASLFKFVSGHPFHPTSRLSYRYGQALVMFHTITDNYTDREVDQTFEPAQLIDEPLEHLAPWFADRQEDFGWLLSLARQIRDVPNTLSDQTPVYGMCHGDINDNNILIVDHQRWALLDFEYIGYGWRVFDIATFINNQVIQRGWGERTWQHIRSFLAGYQAVRPLTRAEKVALPAFVLLRQFWLLGRGSLVQPTIGTAPFQHWLFGQCLPFMRRWVATGWRFEE